jgi:hypothetical protein
MDQQIPTLFRGSLAAGPEELADQAASRAGFLAHIHGTLGIQDLQLEGGVSPEPSLVLTKDAGKIQMQRAALGQDAGWNTLVKHGLLLAGSMDALTGC